MRISNALLTDVSDDSDKNISEDDNSNSDRDDSVSETESDDKSNDDYVPQGNDSDDSVSSIDEEEMHPMNQPESLEKGGVLWSKHGTKARGRFGAVNVLKRKLGDVTSVRTIMDAFKLFITDEIMNEIVLQTNNYAKRHFDQRNKTRLTDDVYRTTPIEWKDLDRVVLEAFIGLLIQASVRHAYHESTSELWNITQLYPYNVSNIFYVSFVLTIDNIEIRLIVFPIRFVLERFVEQLPRHFILLENITMSMNS